MIHYNSFRPAQLAKRDWWLKLQEIQREAYLGSLKRSQNEIDSLVDWHDPDRYISSHKDPNTEVGKRFNANQEFSEPKVVIAHDGSSSNLGFMGFAYGAYNVSGSNALVRVAKKRMIDKNYFWFREIAVRPDHQRKHIALHMAQTLLKGLDDKTPVAAYSWPDEIEHIETPLYLLGFQKTGETQAHPFGKDNEPTRQVRYQGLVGDIVHGLVLLDRQ